MDRDTKAIAQASAAAGVAVRDMGQTTPVILLIEDEAAIADNVIYALTTEGYGVEWRATANEGLALFQRAKPALVILDVGLPDLNGFELLQKLRQRDSTPIIFLTARSDEVDRVVGLEMGADDYVTKPFSPRELTARVRAVLRRYSAPQREEGATPMGADNGPFQVDSLRCQIHYRDTPLTLSRYEYRLLKILLEHPGRVYSRETLLHLAWDYPDHSLDRTVDTHIKTLRAKLREVDPSCQVIKTHRGMGYSLDIAST